MRTIFYLIDLADNKVIETYEGKEDNAPMVALQYATDRAVRTGHTHVLAMGKLFVDQHQATPLAPESV